MIDPQAMQPPAPALPEIAVDERDYYIGRIRHACAAAASATDPTVVDIHLSFASGYLTRLLASVEKQRV